VAPARLALTGGGQGSPQARLQALNAASVASLQLEPFSITEVKAESIVEHRNRLPGGKFESWAQVYHMTTLTIGVGEITVTKLKKIDSRTGVPPVKTHEISLRSY
jgi:DNA uptake protein ComE-like DNA-binding protein